ncbi:hypothetical protein RHSIM_Rhsim04G0092300 [Rhododendron simsii]|uniref:non-specific serine/threonine protein kinase n=1 Tax=Rhododendron simsii TaxID=118357 RepID=A0A834H6Z0_RHOSS|nr:hypothetical protein RHSIM_Rhsim04G0092300 [Rhododendron simsii]
MKTILKKHDKISSSGELPEELAKLTTLQDFQIGDNDFTEKIPDFNQNWVNLTRLERWCRRISKIADEVGGIGKEIIKNYDVVVTNGTLEICFYWAGKGTIGFPVRGVYGTLISAISMHNPGKLNGTPLDFKFLCDFLGIMFGTKNGLLSEGTVIPVKQLSSKSNQGNREFVNEIGMISALQHPHPVKLYGCYIEGNQLLLVYEYMEINCLVNSKSLFNCFQYYCIHARTYLERREECQLQLDWPTRCKICIGIARGLAYLHEEARLMIVHGDMKATNVLPDKNLNLKISDFGLAKLDEEDNTHISTRIAGTYRYMALEYAMHGYLTDKADVYSFRIVALEIVNGRSITSYRTHDNCLYLLDWALVLKKKGNLMELVDPKLGSDFNKIKVTRMKNVALLCTNESPAVRLAMSSVVSMLEARTVPESSLVPNPDASYEEVNQMAMIIEIEKSFETDTSDGQIKSMSD